MRFFEKCQDEVMEVVFPQFCRECKRSLDAEGHSLCWDCRSMQIQIDPPYCSICGVQASGQITHDYICYSCSNRTIHYDKARSPLMYDGVTRNMICSLKYQKATWLVPECSRWLEAGFARYFSQDNVDFISWVPLHWIRSRVRGFNQSALLARNLSKSLQNVPVKSLLRKTRYTTSQTRLTASQRLTNVVNSFALKKTANVVGKRILLIDDVMTTGSTVNEAAKCLKTGGAEQILVLTVARGSS